ncbi:adenylate/guanylate cyclase domain-containing protein [uncultured Ruegeria sp.]|uniref:adenylate/guanylate cyclase domain-containing protein n=1 Tax=uncultured Ruegeria sp. TaxID=259304 RepID=UPI002630FAF2|nr:adenylate/guanylate cyclase domain-containing protein [uncultured Ruegeria sp.]
MRKEAYFAALQCLCDKDILVYRSHLGQAYRREKNVEGMGNSRMKRSLAAVLAADVAGYSKLLGQDTEKTLTSLRRLRTEVFGPTVASRRGRVVKSMGDGWIVLFEAASDAATCALQIQDLLSKNLSPQAPNMQLRLGVHLGDVVEEEEDVFGDGVNVAARLEQIAAPGSIVISDAVFGSLDGTLRPSFDDAGEHDLKNISRPVRVWTRGSLPGQKASDPGTSQRPQIVVRRIETSDPRDEVRELSDALTGDLMTYLGATHWLSVTATESARHSYVLLGRIRASGNRLRLEIKYTDPDGVELWSTKIDGDMDNAFDWQDETAELLVSQVMTATFDRERVQLDKLTIEDMTASQCELRGQLAIDRLDPDAFASALEYSSAAIRKDPSLPHPFALALVAFLSATVMGYERVAQKYATSVPSWCSAAAPLAENHSLLRLALGVTTYSQHREPAILRSTVEYALRQSSSDFVTLALSGWSYVWIGDNTAAIDCFKKADVLGGKSPWALSIRGGLAMATLQAGNDEAAIKLAKDGLNLSVGYATLYRVLAAAQAQLGRWGEATEAVNTALRLHPNDNISSILARNVFAIEGGENRYISGLRKAGMKE